MKKVKIYFLLLMSMIIHANAFGAVVYSTGFENANCNFINGCVPNWINTHGDAMTVDVPNTGAYSAYISVKYNHTCQGNSKFTGSGIALNFNFKKNATYKITYHQLGYAAVKNWILVNNLPNQLGVSSTCSDNFGSWIVPDVPSQSKIVDSKLLNDYNWSSDNFTFTPDDNYNQIWLRCFNEKNSIRNTDEISSEVLIDDFQIELICEAPESKFHFEDKNGLPKTLFCVGEAIFLNGTASVNESAYEIVLSERLISDGPWAPFVWPNGIPLVIPWTSGQIGTVNLTQLIANTGVQFCFSKLKEYQIGLRLGNTCGAYVETNHQFKLECCTGAGAMQSAFGLGDVPNPNGNGFLLSASGYNPYPTYCLTHEWLVYRTFNLNGPYEFVNKVTGPVFQNFATETGYCYLVIHRLITECGTFCFGQQKCNNNGLAQGGPCAFCGPLANCQLPCASPGVFSCGMNQNGQKFLAWNQVEGATGYQLQIITNDAACCPNIAAPMTYTFSPGANPYVIPNFFVNKCFSWKVKAILPGCTSGFSAKQCYNPITSCNPRIGTEEATATTISLYPNPVSDNNLTISIASGDETTQTEIQIFSIDGRMLITTTATGNKEETIDVSKLSSGMYIVKAIQNGQQVYTSKFQKL